MRRGLHTPICDELRIQYPIFSVGFGAAAGPELAAAVSNAGGFGVLGAGGKPPDENGRPIMRTRQLTDRPIGGNLIIAPTNGGGRGFLTNPGGAGRGNAYGAGIAKAMRLGAQGVSLGTRFVASNEAWLHPVYKQRIVDSRAEDTIYNTLYDVWWPNSPHRTLRNKTSEEWEAAGRPPSGSRPGEGASIGKRRVSTGEWMEWPRYAVGTVPPDFEGDVEYAPMWAGESCSVVNDVKPAGQIVRELVTQAEAALAELGTTAPLAP